MKNVMGTCACTTAYVNRMTIVGLLKVHKWTIDFHTKFGCTLTIYRTPNGMKHHEYFIFYRTKRYACVWLVTAWRVRTIVCKQEIISFIERQKTKQTKRKTKKKNDKTRWKQIENDWLSTSMHRPLSLSIIAINCVVEVKLVILS